MYNYLTNKTDKKECVKLKRSITIIERTLCDRPMVVSNKVIRYLFNTEGHLKQLKTNHNTIIGKTQNQTINTEKIENFFTSLATFNKHATKTTLNFNEQAKIYDFQLRFKILK